MKKTITHLFAAIVLLISINTAKSQTYCTVSSYCDSYVNNVTIGTINHNSYCGSGGYEDFSSLVTTLWQGSIYTLSVTMGGASFTSVCNAWADWNNNGSFTDPGEQLFLSAFSTTVGTTTVNVPMTGVNGNVRMRVRTSSSSVVPCGALSYGECEDYTLYLVGANACTGTPAASTTLVSANPACYAQNFTLSLGTTYIDTGISYQWQSSPDGSTWSDIAGATLLNLTTSQLVETYYRCMITCSNSGLYVYSTIKDVTMNVFTNCYCVPGTTNNTNGQEITNVTFAGINNSSGAASPPGYSDFTYLTPGAVTSFSSYTLSVTLYSAGVWNYSSVWIDWNQNGLFETTEYYNMGSSVSSTPLTQVITVPGTALAGPTRMRVRIRDYTLANTEPCDAYTWGETEDYLINVTAATLCSGTPAAAATLASVTNACASTPVNLSLSTAYTNAGLTFQWQSSPDNSTWSNMGSAATSQTYSTTQTATAYYQCVITCTSLSAFTTSTSVMVTQNAPTTCYCIPPTSGTTNFMWLTNVTTTGCIANINNSTPASGLVTYHDYSATAIATQTAGLTVNMSFTASGYPLDYAVLVDYNDNGVFDAGELVLSINTTSSSAFTASGSFTIPLATAGGTHRMRVRGDYYTSATPTDPCSALGYGETEDYGLTVNAVTVCAGTPTAGTSMATSVSICSSGSATLSLSGASSTTGISYQWQQNTGSGFTNMAGATSATANTGTLTTPASVQYQCVLTCSYSSMSATSTPVTVNAYSNPATYATANTNPLCNGDSTELFAVGGISFIWTPGSITNYFISVHPTTTTTYSVTGTDSYGCSGSTTITIVVNNPPTVGCTPTIAQICQGDSSIINATGASTYTWMPGTLTGGSVTVWPVSTTTYTVTGTALTGCSSTSTTTITVNPLPTVTYTQNPDTACISWPNFNLSSGSPTGGTYTGVGVVNTITGMYSPSIAGLGTWNVCYTYSDINSCHRTVCQNMTVDNCTDINQLISDDEISIYPNPFTDEFIVSSIKYQVESIKIYNVIGELVNGQLKINNGQCIVDVGKYSKGLYFVEIKTENGLVRKKVVKE